MQASVIDKLLILQQLNEELNTTREGDLSPTGAEIGNLIELNINRAMLTIKTPTDAELHRTLIDMMDEQKEKTSDVYCIDEQINRANNYKRIVRRNQRTGDTREQVIQDYTRSPQYAKDEEYRLKNQNIVRSEQLAMDRAR